MIKRILLINQYYPPDMAISGRLLADLADGLTGRDFRFDIIAAWPSYTEDAPACAKHEITINRYLVRVGSNRVKGRRRLFNRLFGYAAFLWGAWREGRRRVRRQPPDIIITASNPPLAGWIGARLARRAGVPFLLILHDIHPDIVVQSGKFRLPRWVISGWDRCNRAIFAAAAAIIVPGTALRRTLIEEKGVPAAKLYAIHNWANPEFTPKPPDPTLRQQLKIPDQALWVLYSGNIGISHNLEWLLAAAGAIADAEIQLLFLGEGLKKPELEAWTAREGLTKVRFLPYQLEGEYRRILESADLGVVAIEPGLEGLAFPSKTYTMLAAGLPLLALTGPETEIVSIITEYDCGWAVNSPDELAGVLRSIQADKAALARKKVNARAAYMGNFSRQRACQEYRRVIEEVLKG
jgi:glycosyltransferase involved in cell wall biosynthesis